MKFCKTALSLALACSALASPARATDVTSVQLAGPGGYTLSVNGESVYDDALLLNGTILALCDDTRDGISLGTQAPLHFDDVAMAAGSIDPSTGLALSAAQVSLMANLTSAATIAYQTGDSNLAQELAAFQFALWGVVDPGSSFTNVDSGVAALAQTYLADAGSRPATGTLTQLTSRVGVQDQLTFASIASPVPEAGTWLTFIVGLALCGIGLRRIVLQDRVALAAARG